MKALFKSVAIAMAIFSAPIVSAQECSNFIHFKEGTSMTQKTYDEKDRLSATVKQQVTKVDQTAGATKATIHSEMLDKNDKQQAVTDFTINCKDNAIQIDMQNFVPAQTMKAFGNMQVKAEGDMIEFPSNLTAGQTLNNGKMHMIITTKDGDNFATMDYTMTDRKVEKMESITTPAGTFETYKIPYNFKAVTTTFGIPITVEGSAVEWFSAGTGVVRSETFDKKGKLNGYTVLTELKKTETAGPGH